MDHIGSITSANSVLHFLLLRDGDQKEKRKLCWDSRDLYWKCLDKWILTNDNALIDSNCGKLQAAYENNCPTTWVKYFNSRRSQVDVKKKLRSSDDPVDLLPDVKQGS